MGGDHFLHPDEWLDVATNEGHRNDIRNSIDKCFNDALEYVYDVYEKVLLMYWEDHRINFTMYTDDMLADPNDSIQYSMENLIYQMQTITNDLPVSFDKTILRVKCAPVKEELHPLPKECLHKIFNMMPKFITEMSKELGKYLDCLLYTSPSPRDQRGSRMPSSA